MTPTNETSGKTPIKIFLAEDNAADRFWLEMVLKNTPLDYTLAVAADGEEAKEYLRHHRSPDVDAPDLILLDMNMPGLTAFELLEQLPENKQLPVCILTGAETGAERFRKEFGDPTHRYIQKPLTQAKLIDCLRSFETLRPLADEIAR